MGRPNPTPSAPKLYPPLDGPHLPAILSLGWAVGIRADHFGPDPLSPMVRTWLEAALDAHAGEVLPLIVGAVRVEDDLMHFTMRLRRLARRGGELVERDVEVPFAYDRRTGQWGDGGLTVGTGITDFLLWHAHAVLGRTFADRQEARQALLSRLLSRLGATALEDQFARSPGAGRPARAIRAGIQDASSASSCSSASHGRHQRKRG